MSPYITHCYFIRLNPKRISPCQFYLPALLGIHRNPRQKYFFESRINSNNGPFITIPIKSFGSKKLQVQIWLTSVILEIFQTGQGRPCLMLVRPSRIPSWISKMCFALGSQQCWKTILSIEWAHSFRLQSGKITVCFPYCPDCPNDPKLQIHVENLAKDPSVNLLCASN